MRILLSSICAFFLIGCASYPKKNGFRLTGATEIDNLNPYFSDTSKDYVYKAKIDAFDKSFGGLFIVKKIGENNQRIVFTTEMGNTIFDFTFQEDNFKVNRILKEMDKKILINILKNDFKALIEEHLPILQVFSTQAEIVVETEILSKKYYFYHVDHQLNKIARVKSGKEVVVFQFSGDTPSYAKEIRILHKNIKLQIVLTALE